MLHLIPFDQTPLPPPSPWDSAPEALPSLSIYLFTIMRPFHALIGGGSQCTDGYMFIPPLLSHTTSRLPPLL